MNYEYIATKLCVNKDKVELECNGKCYLMKSLAAAAEEESQQKKEQNAKKAEIPLLFLEDQENENQLSFEIRNIQPSYFYENRYFRIVTSEFFHPPCS